MAFLRRASRLSHQHASHVKAQQAIQTRLKELRKTAGRQLRSHIEAVDARITEAAERERTILVKQAAEEETHLSLQQRISALERALVRYVAYQQGRSKRLRAVEKRVKEQHATKKVDRARPVFLNKKAVMDAMKAQLTRLEVLRKDADSEASDPARLAIIDQKIAILQKKLGR